MMRHFSNFMIAFAIVSSVAAYQEPVADSKEFAASVLVGKQLYVADSVKEIKANGRSYLELEKLQTVNVVPIMVVGSGQPYIEIWKVGSDSFPSVIDEYEPGKYLYEHAGPGRYRIRSTDSRGRPAYAEVVIETSAQPPPGPVEPPPTNPGDHAELRAIVQRDAPAGDTATAVALGAAYSGAVLQASAPGMTLDQARGVVSQARQDALLKLPFLTANWNTMLVNAGKYLEKQTAKESYLAAVKVLADELSKIKPATVNSANAGRKVLFYRCVNGQCFPVYE